MRHVCRLGSTNTVYVTPLSVGARVFYDVTHWAWFSIRLDFDFFSFLGDCISTSILSRDSCVYLRHVPLSSPSSMTTTVVLPHNPIQTSFLTRYEQPVSVTRPCPSMKNSPWSK